MRFSNGPDLPATQTSAEASSATGVESDVGPQSGKETINGEELVPVKTKQVAKQRLM